MYFYKEAAPGFYVSISKDDIGCRIPMDDMIVLKVPKTIFQKRIKQWAFEFPENIRELILSYFQRK